MNRKPLTKRQLLEIYRNDTEIARVAGVCLSTVSRNWRIDDPIPAPWAIIFRNLINPERLDKEKLSPIWKVRKKLADVVEQSS